MYCSEKISQISGEQMSGEQMSGEQMSCEHLSHWAIVGEQISQWANVAWAIVLWAIGVWAIIFWANVVWNFDRDVSKYEGEQMSEWAIVGLPTLRHTTNFKLFIVSLFERLARLFHDALKILDVITSRAKAWEVRGFPWASSWIIDHFLLFSLTSRVKRGTA